MDRQLYRRLLSADVDEILEYLSTRQFLQPHRPLREVLHQMTVDLKVCPAATERAVQWLGIDAGVATGRLRRSELVQLARCIQRLWRQAPSDEARQAQPDAPLTR